MNTLMSWEVEDEAKVERNRVLPFATSVAFGSRQRLLRCHYPDYSRSIPLLLSQPHLLFFLHKNYTLSPMTLYEGLHVEVLERLMLPNLSLVHLFSHLNFTREVFHMTSSCLGESNLMRSDPASPTRNFTIQLI